MVGFANRFGFGGIIYKIKLKFSIWDLLRLVDLVLDLELDLFRTDTDLSNNLKCTYIFLTFLEIIFMLPDNHVQGVRRAYKNLHALEHSFSTIMVSVKSISVWKWKHYIKEHWTLFLIDIEYRISALQRKVYRNLKRHCSFNLKKFLLLV